MKRVLNLQDEYGGPVDAYARAEIHQLRLPVVDHFEPSHAQIVEGVGFIEKAQLDGAGVYIHCQGGHGRSAAIVFAWLCRCDQSKSPLTHNQELYSKWRVRTGLHSQPSITRFLNELK